MTSADRHNARYQRRKAKREAKRREFLCKFDDFDRMSSVSALLEANWAARKGVMWKASVARYNMHAFKNARKSHRALQAGEDTRKGYYHFQIVERGKARDVHSLHYAERVIRRSACTNAMVPILAHTLIYDNGASLKNKGVSFSINRCATHLHKFWRENRNNDGYVLVIDYRKFFANIQHGPLLTICDENFKDAQLNRLCRGFISATGERGLYIGPEDSQISAVAYPNRIDHLIKDIWRQKYFARYMDDSYIIFRTKEEAILYRDLLMEEFKTEGIIPNPKKTQIIKLRRGFTFLKTQFYLEDSGRVLMKPCRENIIRQRRKLKAFRRFVDRGEMTLDQVENAYMSWRGSLEESANRRRKNKRRKIQRKNAHRSVVNMDRYYYHLFACRPWLKKRKNKRKRFYHHGKHQGCHHGRNYSAQKSAC